jgi:hypothetical protein
MKLLPALSGLVLTAFAGVCQAAPTPPSVLSLYQRIPDPPATAQEAAAKWVDKNGTLIHPELIALKADLEAHEKAMEELAKPAAAQAMKQGEYQVESLGKGMADVGIDMARMQSDPAYRAQVQARMQKMSPAELMAMSQQMNKPMQQDKRIVNQAKAMNDDPAAVREAAEAGYAYSSQQVDRIQAFQVRWQQMEDGEVKKITSTALPKVGQRKPAMEYDNIGCDNSCQAQWDAYAAKVLPLMIARDNEILKIRRAALLRERSSIAADIKTADGHLVATRYGAASQSQANQSRIRSYDAAALGAIMQIVYQLEDSARSAAVVTHCGDQVVKVPGAVCR